MKLHLVRHAHAVTAEEDPARPLSARGRADARRLAGFFRGNRAFQPAQLWHSPLARARETAVLLAAGLAPEPLLIETPGLQPDDDPLETARRLAAYPASHDLALVGHEPHLSALATLLVRGRPQPAAFALKKGAVLTLERGSGIHKKSALPRWRVRWHFSPELLGPADAPSPA